MDTWRHFETGTYKTLQESKDKKEKETKRKLLHSGLWTSAILKRYCKMLTFPFLVVYVGLFVILKTNA